METAPQNSRKGMHTGAAIFGMAVTFFVGVYVGLHPLWIPFDVGATNVNAGLNNGTSAPHTSDDRPATTTQASQPA